MIEAGIDFSDEGDVPAELIAPALATIKSLLHEIEETLAAQGRSERLRDGLTVAISGPPNVGKSTLINLLARREVAIVSPHAGTTRDVIEVQLDLDGYPVTVIDTAGIRDTEDPVEQEGVRRARSRAAESDLVLWVTDAEHEQERSRSRRRPHATWMVRNKIDLDPAGGEQGRGRRFGRGRGTRRPSEFPRPGRWHFGVGRRARSLCAGLFRIGRGRSDRPRAAAAVIARCGRWTTPLPGDRRSRRRIGRRGAEGGVSVAGPFARPGRC